MKYYILANTFSRNRDIEVSEYPPTREGLIQSGAVIAELPGPCEILAIAFFQVLSIYTTELCLNRLSNIEQI